MAKEKEEVKDEAETKVDGGAKGKKESAEKAEYRNLLEAYALAHPEQWERKKDHLMAKLDAMV